MRGAAAVLRTAQEQGIELIPEGDRLHYRGPRGVLTPDMLTELKRHKSDLIALLSLSHETRPCSRCHRFAFDKSGVVCYWCRRTPEARA